MLADNEIPAIHVVIKRTAGQNSVIHCDTERGDTDLKDMNTIERQ